MNMTLFYLYHNITRFHFARLIGVSNGTMFDYETGNAVDYKTKNKIEIAIDIFKTYDIVYSKENVRNAKADAYFEKMFKARINKTMEF